MNTAIQELAEASSRSDNNESEDLKLMEKTLFGHSDSVYTKDQVKSMLTDIMMLSYQQGWNKEQITPVEQKIEELL